MKKEKYLSDIREKFPDYADVDDNKLFVDFSKKFPAYVASDEELKEEFLELANENEGYSSDNINLTPEEVYTLAASIPEYRPPRSEFEQFKKHDPDVDWGTTGKAAVSHIANLVARGFSWDEEANIAMTAVEGAAQGWRGLHGIATQSADPNSIFFKGKKLLGEVFSGKPDASGYKQWLEARDFAQQSYRLEQGEEQLISDEFKVNRKAAAALGLVLDPSLFVSFGSGTAAKTIGRVAAAGARGSGRGLKAAGRAVSRPIETITEKVSEGIVKTFPDVPEQAAKSGVIAATGTGAVVTPVGQAVGTAYAGAKVAETAGDILQGVGEQMAGQPSRAGVFAGLAADTSRSKLTRGVARTASVLGGDTVLNTAGVASRGALEGAAVGGGLGYLSAREEGAAGGVSGGGAFGVAGGLAGHGFRKVSGAQRKSAIKNEFARFLESRPKLEREGIVKMTGGDLEQAALVMDIHDLVIGNSKQDVAVKFLNNEDFLKLTEGQKARGVEYVKGDKPAIAINTDYQKGSHTLAHESFHAIKKLDGMDAYFQRIKNEIVGIKGAGGEVIRNGILTDRQLAGLASKYMSKFSDDYKAEFRKDWVNKTVEELSAEWFAALLTGGKKDALLAGKGFDSLTRKALDRLLLADAYSTFGKMQNALQNVFGTKFGVSGEPLGSMVFKDAAGNPLKHDSPVIQAIMRDMVRGKKAISDAHAMDNKLSKSVVRTRNLSQQELTRLRDSVKGSSLEEIFVTDKKGRLKALTPKQAAAVEAETAGKIIDAIDRAPDTGDSSHVRKTVDEKGNTVYSGLKFSEGQLKQIYASDIHPSIKEFLGTLHESLGDGRIFDIEYWAALRKGSYASIKMARRNVVPYNILVSKEGNFFARALDISSLDRKFQDWKKGKKEWLKHWDSDEGFYRDIQGYLTNLALPEPAPSSSLFGETKRNIMNEFIGARGRQGMNPLALLKVAEKEFLIRSFRLDRMASLNIDNSFRRFPFSETSYKLNKVNYMPLVDGMELGAVPKIPLRKLEGISVFPIIADLTKVGKFKGIDSSQVGELLLFGGPEYPSQKASIAADLLWAFDAKGKITEALNLAKETGGYAVVTAMKEDSHQSNASFIEAYLSTLDAYARDGKITPEGLAKADEVVKSTYIRFKFNEWNSKFKKAEGKEPSKIRENRKRRELEETASKIPHTDQKAFHKWQVGQTFDVRSSIAESLGKPTVAESYNFPSRKKVLDETRSPKQHGRAWGDAMYLVKLDLDSPIVTLGEGKYPAHPSYKFGVKGKVVGELSKAVNLQVLFKDFITKHRKDGRGDGQISYMFKKPIPIQKITKQIVKESGVDAYDQIRNSRQAQAVVDSLNGNWARSGVAVKDGGVKVAEFVRALKENVLSPTLKQYTKKEVDKLIKDGEMKVFQLHNKASNLKVKDRDNYQIFFALRKDQDGVWNLESVVNNEMGAKGIGGPSVMIKAIQEGAQKLDAFAAPSKQNPNGFLYDYYRQFGFKETGRLGFDEQLYLQDNRKSYELDDLKHGLKKYGKWDETMGDPEVSYMEIDIDANNRQTYGRDFVNPSEGIISRLESASETRKGEVPERGGTTGNRRGARSRDSGQDTGAQEGVRGTDLERSDAQSRLTRLVDEVVNLGKDDVNNLGIDQKQFNKAKARIGKPDGPLFMPESETTLGKSKITEKGDGYRTIKRDGKTRIYSPTGKLLGVASSEKVADNIYRRHSGTRTNNIRQRSARRSTR